MTTIYTYQKGAIKVSTIKGRMNNYIGISALKEYLDINYEEDAKEAYEYIYPSRYKAYVVPDLYSPLLYRIWGELLKKKGVVETYEIFVKDYRYVIRGKYIYQQNTEYEILGSDGLMSISKCVDGIKLHKYIGGFALWPSHSGGINFRKNRYKDDIFKTLHDIEMFYKNPKEYRGVIPEQDYKWFLHLGENGGFMDVFFFSDYEKYNNLLDFEKDRTAEMIKFLKDEGANR